MNLSLTTYNKRALYGGIIAAVIVGLGAFLIGNVSGYEAKQLLKSSLPGFNTLSNTIVLASATILALLLTLLSVSSASESKLKEDHYRQVLRIAKIDTSVFIVALICFQLFNIPLAESDSVPTRWFTSIYYITISVSALLSGALITVAIMLYNAVINLVKIIGLKEDDNPLVYAEDDKEDDKDQQKAN